MTSLGYSEFTENGNVPPSNNKNINRRSGNVPKNRTLKVPRDESAHTSNTGNMSGERGIQNSINGSGVMNENGNNNGVIQQAGNRVKQIKDYIENIHRKGGEDSDPEDEDDGRYTSVLPSYPAQGMGVYATNTTSNTMIRGEDNGAGSGPIPSTISSNNIINNNNNVVRKTTQLTSLNPSSAYSSTLMDGTNSASIQTAAATAGISPFTMPYGENGRKSNPLGIPKVTNKSFSNNENTTSTYAKQYYEQFVPYAENLANQLASQSGASGTNIALVEKLNYIIHMLEQKKEEKTGHVIEELILYCFIGIFIIFVVDTFARSGGVGRGGGGGGGGFMNGGGGAARYRRNISS
jgi:hypothetical protein